MDDLPRLAELALGIEPDATAMRAEFAADAGGELCWLLACAYPPLRPAHEWQRAAVAHLSAAGIGVAAERARMLDAIRSELVGAQAGEPTLTLIRRAVWKQKARIALRELVPRSLGGPDVDTTSAELSVLAEVSCELALEEAKGHVTRRIGAPVRAEGGLSDIVVFGMGKLGGGELNAGSDIDLIFVYDTDDVDGEIAPHRYFTEVIRRMVATLETPTADGMMWRVDLRLRPEGSRGPLAASVAATERYYEAFGRTWERAALLRARPIAGDLELGELVVREVFTPFVYRREVDPRLATALAEMVQSSREQLCRDPERDLKLGPGGIREAEFFVQALQLIWGGRDPGLRTQSLFTALDRLRASGLVSEEEAGDLLDAYLLLRRAEHRIQWMRGIQTHEVPSEPELCAKLARSLWFESAAEFLAALAQARERVAAIFQSCLPEAPRPQTPFRAFLDRLLGGEEPSETELLFGAVEVADHLAAMARRPGDMLGARTLERNPAHGERLLSMIAQSSDPEQASRMLRSYLARFSFPAAVVSPLVEDPPALQRLVTVLGASALVGEAITARPALAELILYGQAREGEIEPAEQVREEIALLGDLDAIEDPLERCELLVGALRRARSQVMVQVASADLSGRLDTARTTRALAELADASVEVITRFELEDQPTGLAVIGVGKFGGREMGYGSDLDVLFIYDEAAAPEGQHAASTFARRAQRIIRDLSAPHAAGPGYELDTRLRPSGSQGMLVTSLPAFARYHGVPLGAADAAAEGPSVLSSGEAWERQALLRARVVGGDAELGARFMVVAHRAAYGGGAPDPAELHHLRRRMEVELGRERAGRYDIKLGRGGLLDIEFVTQWLQMVHGNDPRVRHTSTAAALEALRAAGYLAQSAFDALHGGYDFLRTLEQRMRVLTGAGETTINQHHPGLRALARRMGRRRTPDATETEQLLHDYRAVTSRVRDTYLAVLGVAEGE